MKDLKTYMKFSGILDEMFNDIHSANNKLSLNPDTDTTEEQTNLKSNFEKIEFLCQALFNGMPPGHNDFRRHINFGEKCDYEDMIERDFKNLKSGTVDRILSPSNNAFIAMSFTHENRDEIEVAIKDSCAELGYNSIVVDKEEFLGGISDEIKALIDKSEFVIADFTENKQGVYFEAGFAEGRNLPVIYCVQESEIKKLHFDTKHLNHIGWKDPQDLKERLIKRIKSTIL